MGGEAEFAARLEDGPLVKKKPFPRERTGASLLCVGAPVYLDKSNVVIDVMTNLRNCSGAAEAAPLQAYFTNVSEAEFMQ